MLVVLQEKFMFAAIKTEGKAASPLRRTFGELQKFPER